MAASYHHTKEALSLPECCLHPSHLHSQLGSLMSEYDKWIEDVSNADFPFTNCTDKSIYIIDIYCVVGSSLGSLTHPDTKYILQLAVGCMCACCI